MNRSGRRQRDILEEENEEPAHDGHESPPEGTGDEDTVSDKNAGKRFTYEGKELREITNPFQAFVESIVFGTAATIGSVDYFGNKGGWPLKQAIPDNFFCVLALLYGVSEMAEGWAIYRCSENPDIHSGRSYTFPYMEIIADRGGVGYDVPFGYHYEREQKLKGILQILTAFFIAEGAVEGLVGNYVGSPVGLSALGFNLPARLCAHFVGKCFADFYDFWRLFQEPDNNIINSDRRRTANLTILFNLFTNALAATAFGLLASGNPLGFVFLAGFALARSWQNKHRPGLFKGYFPPLDADGNRVVAAPILGK